MTALRIFFVSLVLLTMFAAAVPLAYAQECKSAEFCPLTDVQGSRLETIYPSTGEQTLSGFLTGLFTAVISVAAIVAVLRLGYAGYLYMTSESWGSKGKAKEVMGDVALGLLLLLSCWLILNQINPDILKLDILNSLKGAQVAPAAQQPPTAPQVQIPEPSVVQGQLYNTWSDPAIQRLIIFRNRIDGTCTYYDPETQAPPQGPQYAAIRNGQCPPEGAAANGPL